MRPPVGLHHPQFKTTYRNETECNEGLGQLSSNCSVFSQKTTNNITRLLVSYKRQSFRNTLIPSTDPHQVHYQCYVYTHHVRHLLTTNYQLYTHTLPTRTTWWTTSTHYKPWCLCSMSVASSTSTSRTPLEWTTLSHCETLSLISATTILISSWWVNQ